MTSNKKLAVANLSTRSKQVVNPCVSGQTCEMTKPQSHERETFEPVERAPEAQAEKMMTDMTIQNMKKA